MEPASPYRPRVSREMRLLLTAGVLSLAALWLLARFRFQDLSVTPNPIPAVLSQLNNGPKYDDLAAEIAQLQTRLEASLLVLDLPAPTLGPRPTSHRIAALRFRDDVAVAFLPDASIAGGSEVLGRDPASGLTVLRVPGQPSSLPVPWIPRRLQQPRYLAATDVSQKSVSLQPVFVGSLDPFESPLWSESIWTVPEHSDLAPGSLLFAGNAELAGMVIAYDGERAIVPGATLFEEAERLLERPKAPGGTIGVEVQALTEPLASLTGAPVGVVVTWVERDGAAAGRIRVGDVIEAVDARAMATRQHWDVRAARLSGGETLTLRVRRDGDVQDVELVATSAAAPAGRSLGLTLRGRAGIGTEVIRVDPASAAARAGLAVGDVITLVAAFTAPTPAQVRRSFASVPEGQRVMIAVTRGDEHHVTTLER